MAEKPSPTHPSNEQVIDDITKDFESSCRASDSNGQSSKDGAKSRSDEPSVDPLKASDRDPDDELKSDKVPDESPLEDDDYVDEECLKDKEVEMSEDEKATRRTDAEAMKNKGNDLFRAGVYDEALLAYTEALWTCPLAFDNDRAILYANRAAAKMKYMDDKKSPIADCSKAIELNPKYLRAYLRRAQLYEQVNKLDDALADFKTILELDPSNYEANHAVRRLPPLIEAANEKLKTEMLGKLKDLGNIVLKPFGLSTNNFELEQNSEGGGYSIKFNQNTS